MSNNEHKLQSIKSQLDKLEKISNQISLLISAGEYGKINHLDKMRKKIINDMILVTTLMKMITKKVF